MSSISGKFRERSKECRSKVVLPVTSRKPHSPTQRQGGVDGGSPVSGFAIPAGPLSGADMCSQLLGGLLLLGGSVTAILAFAAMGAVDRAIIQTADSQQQKGGFT
jgi:hypothetical protein